MQYFWRFLGTLAVLVVTLNAVPQKDEVILYYGNGCSHCAHVERVLKEHNLEDKFVKKEIYQNLSNAEEFNTVCDEHKIKLMERTIPLLYTKEGCFIGDEAILTYINGMNKVLTDLNKSKTNSSKREEVTEEYPLTLPLLIGAAIVDAINPCAFAVLLILMTTILATQNRRKALYTGLAFSFAIFVSYLAMGLGLYSVVTHFETTHKFMIIIGVIAILLGIFNIKDYFWYGKGFLMEVPLSWRTRLKSLIGSIVNPIGAFFIGILISLFLLPCTSGPYIVITSMLGHSETFMNALMLLLLYNFIFILPMILITIGVSFGMDVNKAEEVRQRNLQRLHLAAGTIMLLMGIAILFYYI
ncbi:MAG: Cytochrome c biogenesis transmembrane protein [uncultured Sulfurovum sp.]|uniref:Cytochrome c biogenesis transmembrane protein n=1 Tax=uncultured Sulfurovum sp. TaxID=269237 RepID=A0A6S6TJ53_9BACT|nr:MAG: Cytochrome c biogenesis transmembrane protein [uncultured Sulfurovum sp.]